MRIQSIEALAVDVPLTKNFGGSTYAVLKRSTVVTRVRTDEGLVSEVYNGDNREHQGWHDGDRARPGLRRGPRRRDDPALSGRVAR